MCSKANIMKDIFYIILSFILVWLVAMIIVILYPNYSISDHPRSFLHKLAFILNKSVDNKVKELEEG